LVRQRRNSAALTSLIGCDSLAIIGPPLTPTSAKNKARSLETALYIAIQVPILHTDIRLYLTTFKRILPKFRLSCIAKITYT
jgi:hypothetical protein